MSETKMWAAIGRAYNMVDCGDSTRVDGAATGVEWKVYRVGGMIRVDVQKVS